MMQIEEGTIVHKTYDAVWVTGSTVFPDIIKSREFAIDVLLFGIRDTYAADSIPQGNAVTIASGISSQNRDDGIAFEQWVFFRSVMIHINFGIWHKIASFKL
jgi:hypothetical protein